MSLFFIFFFLTQDVIQLITRTTPTPDKSTALLITFLVKHANSVKRILGNDCVIIMQAFKRRLVELQQGQAGDDQESDNGDDDDSLDEDVSSVQLSGTQQILAFLSSNLLIHVTYR